MHIRRGRDAEVDRFNILGHCLPVDDDGDVLSDIEREPGTRVGSVSVQSVSITIIYPPSMETLNIDNALAATKRNWALSVREGVRPKSRLSLPLTTIASWNRFIAGAVWR
jgi:hypothetical protein